MRILLLGEFSRLHNSLKEGLVALGHEVTLVSAGDDFKGFPSDFSIRPRFSDGSKSLSFAGKVLRKITGHDLASWEKGLRFKKLLPKLHGYDVVQLINSDAIETVPWLSKKLYRKLFSQNDKIFLLVCGDETPVVDYWLSHPEKRHVLSAYFAFPDKKAYFRYTLKYVSAPYRKLYDYVRSKAKSIISSDLDYHLPLNEKSIPNTLIPNPVNVALFPETETNDADTIRIFHGINKYNSIKKGNRFFEEALDLLKEKYAGKIEVITAHSLPYSEYDTLRKSAHIVLDQVYGDDQGYNALEAMARGQVVCTCSGDAFRTHYKLKEDVAIEARPDVAYLTEQLSHFIEDPEAIRRTGNAARRFIEKEHHYVNVGRKYIETWEKA